METFKVNKNSWHYKLVREHVIEHYPFDIREDAMPKDFCSYWRRVVIESMKIGIMISVSVAAIVAIVVLVGIVFYTMIFNFSEVGFIFLTSFTITSVIALAVYSPFAIRRYRINKIKQGDSKPNGTSNIFAQKYRSWKDKYCPAIDYGDTK